MFSGIIKETGIVKKLFCQKGGLSIAIKSKLKFTKKDLGSSINCSGVCLTLEKISNNLYYFFLSTETLMLTTFKNIKINDVLNLECSLKFSNEISGHFVQGHVDTTSFLKKKIIKGKSWYLYFSTDKIIKKFIVYKGSISINGISLTISKIFKKGFLVVVIPHTVKSTNLINIKKNDIVNIEIDILAKYIKKIK